MAVNSSELKSLQRQVEQLQQRVARLESRKRTKRSAPRKSARPPTSRQNIIALLEKNGVIRSVTPEEQHLAAEWNTLASKEKKRVNQALRQIHLDTSLAELVREVRS